jgi:hypothetical protein
MEVARQTHFMYVGMEHDGYVSGENLTTPDPCAAVVPNFNTCTCRLTENMVAVALDVA